jgi:trypsin
MEPVTELRVMTRVHVVLASLLSLGLLGTTLSASFAAGDTEMIVAGSEAPEGKYPYQVRLYSSMEDEVGFCGGSIIAPQWVLTAGHCMTEGNFAKGPTTATEPDKVVVGYGSNDRTRPRRSRSRRLSSIRTTWPRAAAAKSTLRSSSSSDRFRMRRSSPLPIRTATRNISCRAPSRVGRPLGRL